MIRSQRSGIVMVLTMALLPETLPSARWQEPAVGYAANQLNCARFLETVASNILTEAAGRTRRQTSDRRGVWQFRAGPPNDDVALEGWLDSLVLSRSSPEATITPDTDGLLGGRYRGALDDFFPPLPSRALKPGEEWTDSLGLTIRRLPDSAMSGVPLLRFGLESRRESRAAPTPTDTLPLKLRQKTEERGEFVWHPLLGLLRRDRRIVVETTVPPSRSVRQAVRSKVEQRITLVRDLTQGAGCAR